MKKQLSCAIPFFLGFMSVAQAQDLTSKDLRNLFPGNYSVVIYNIFTVQVTMGKNGELNGLSRGKRDTGRWSIEGNKFCLLWKSWTKGKKGCSTLKRDGGYIKGDGFYFKV
jgi:hypothetical protein